MKSGLFFSEFLTNASQVGSVIPSSSFLLRKMLPITIPWHKMTQIAELGPGTGVFTQYIQQERTSSSELYLFEKNNRFKNNLHQRFPQLPLYNDALKLKEVVKETNRPFDLIVSGLPFTNFSNELQDQLFHTINDALASNGVFVAFQYSLLLKRKFNRYFRIMDTGFTWINIPPAWVFKCGKREE
jgi:phospholipid N-methyltransferase